MNRPRRLLSVRTGVGAGLVTVVLTATVLTGCQARPGDAPTVVAPQTVETDAPATEDGPVPEELRTVTVGVDGIPADLNPHLVGSRSPATSIVAALTLPSAFTVPSDGGDRRTELNTDLLDSVTVTGGTEDAPTAVRYVISPAAQWSDGTPVTGSDFDYLRRQITSVPGVTGPADYAMIDRLDVTAGGRTVDVTFTAPDPDWRELFADLLPAHIYRAEDRSFPTMMAAVPAASGGVFRVRAFDATRGVIELERNERFWGEHPARTDRLVLSVVPDQRTAAQMLRSGQLQMVMTGRQGVTAESLASLPGTRVRTLTRRPELTLTLNTTAERMVPAAARSAVVDALDTGALARILTGDPSATAPDRLPGSGDVVGDDLSGDLSSGASTSVPAAGTPSLPAPGSGLTPLRIGADSADATAVEAARRVADQLMDADIDATVVARPSKELYGDFLPAGTVDAVVAWQETPETLGELRGRYGCDPTVRPVSRAATALPPVTALPTGSAPASTSATGTAEPTEPTDTTGGAASTAAAEPSEGQATELSGRTENISGTCSADIDAVIDAAALSAGTVGQDDAVAGAVDQVRTLVGRHSIDVPLLADTVVVAVGQDLAGPARRLADWPVDRETGPFLSAGQWRRTGEPDGGAAASSSASTTTEPIMTETEEKHP